MPWPAPVEVAVVRITTRSGAIEVVAEAGRTEVWSSTGLTPADGRRPTIDGGSSKVRVLLPEGTDVVIGSTSGRVDVRGRVGAVSALTTSGRISVEEAKSVDVRTVSGRVDVGRVEGECRVVTTSARVEVGRCGDAVATTRSGRIVLHDAHGAVHAHCTSGRIDVGLGGAVDVDAETVSGRINIVLPADVRPLVATAPATLDVASGYDCVVVARSVSGRVGITNR
jgi:DUF4097 and DUF4098 domain-containing protein YvlB